MSADSLAASIALAEKWLLTSGIQDRSNDPELHGGMHAWYDISKPAFSFYYTEITGYAVTMYCFLHAQNGDKASLEAASAAGEWLLKRAFHPQTGALLCRRDQSGWMSRACAFDNGMCLNGLLNLHRITRKDETINASRVIGDWLLTTMRGPDGLFISKYDTVKGQAHNPGGKWSLISGAFLIKLAIGLLQLAERTGEAKYADAVRDLCDWGLTLQEPDGRFRTSPDKDVTFLHPHCYAAEGMLVAGTVLKEKRYMDAAAKAVAWIAPHQRYTGGFPGYYEHGKFIQVESPDMSAQVLRVWMQLPEAARAKIGIKLESALNHLLSYQCHDQGKEVYGGFFSGSAWFHGEGADPGRRDVNSWVTMFTTQALVMANKGKMEPFFVV